MSIFKNLHLAGWISIGTAILTIPIVVLGLYGMFALGTSGEKNILLIAVEMIINSAYLFMFVVMLINFKYLLNEHLNVRSLNFLVMAMIVANIILTIPSIISMPFGLLGSPIDTILTLLLIPYGILHTIFGIKIILLDDPLFGWRKSFSIFTIFTGISLATIILMPLGLITSVVSDVLMAIIFFSAAKTYSTEKINA